MQTRAAHENNSPVGDSPDSQRGSAPTMEIGDLFAASKSMETVIISSGVKPALIHPLYSHRFSWTPESVTALVEERTAHEHLAPNSL